MKAIWVDTNNEIVKFLLEQEGISVNEQNVCFSIIMFYLIIWYFKIKFGIYLI